MLHNEIRLDSYLRMLQAFISKGCVVLYTEKSPGFWHFNSKYEWIRVIFQFMRFFKIEVLILILACPQVIPTCLFPWTENCQSDKVNVIIIVSKINHFTILHLLRYISTYRIKNKFKLLAASESLVWRL